MMILLMFSLFSTGLPSQDKQTTVLFLILMLTVLNLSTHLIWISSSAYLVKTFVKGNNQKVQGILFSISLALVGIWFLWDNILFK
jgi:threonine/homoserine/homoserine lactone efflux protein